MSSRSYLGDLGQSGPQTGGHQEARRAQAAPSGARPSQRLRATLRPAASIVCQSAVPGDAGLVIAYTAPGCVIAHVRNMTFSAWNTAPTVEHVEAFMSLAEQLSNRYAQNSNVTLVQRGTELPGAEARTSLEVLTARYARVIHSVALVIDGGGFWASMIRSFLTGLHLLRGNGYRCKAFATPAAANPWLLPAHNADTGEYLTEREMREACEAVVARIRAEGAAGAVGLGLSASKG